MRTDFASSPFIQEYIEQVMVAALGAQGRIAAADQLSSGKVMRLAEERGLPADYLAAAQQQGLFDFVVRDRPADGLQKISASLARHPFASIPAYDRPYPGAAATYARAGRVDEARQVMAEYTPPRPRGDQRGQSQPAASADG